MSIYKVGMGSNTANVKAPSPEAAALFYITNCVHSVGLPMVVIYEQDGKEYEGAKLPLMFGLGFSQYLALEVVDIAEKLDPIVSQIGECELVG
jgi:hypothetical protein